MELCGTCLYFDSRQTGRPKVKGYCHFFPKPELVDSAHWCGQHSPEQSCCLQNESRPGQGKNYIPSHGSLDRIELRKRLKELGVRPLNHWNNEKMREEIKNAEEQTTEAVDGQGQT